MRLADRLRVGIGGLPIQDAAVLASRLIRIRLCQCGGRIANRSLSGLCRSCRRLQDGERLPDPPDGLETEAAKTGNAVVMAWANLRTIRYRLKGPKGLVPANLFDLCQ